MASDVVSASTEFDIFGTKPVQTWTLETTETAYKPIVSLDQSDLEFLIIADHADLRYMVNMLHFVQFQKTNISLCKMMS